MFDHASRNNLADYIVAYYVSVTRANLVERCHIVYARRWRNVGRFATRNLVSPSAKGKQKKEKQINLELFARISLYIVESFSSRKCTRHVSCTRDININVPVTRKLHPLSFEVEIQRRAKGEFRRWFQAIYYPHYRATDSISLSLSLYLYIYMYIHIRIFPRRNKLCTPISAYINPFLPTMLPFVACFDVEV